ncbi:MAG: hypothetical protein E6I88_03610 [Chloroflexi bacterium]|nr:MAG: hypothetical protein E6I88_03610 [Chloroflexota bacterium]TME48810.1 MAG: hypothetical protein E6I56_00250 [Chloroflexota bacterium]
MGVAYSTIEAFSPPEAMEAFLSERIIAPLLPSVRVKKVKKAREGRRYEIPRVLWNVYEATLEMADGEETQRLFWTKAYFADQDREHYQTRIQSLLDRRNGSPLDPKGYARVFPELNLFVFFFPTDPQFSKLGTVYDAGAMREILLPHFAHLNPSATLGPLASVRVKYLPEIASLLRYDADVGEEAPLSIYGKVQHSRRGQLTYDVMRALWDLPARVSGELRFAEPLGYYPDYDLVLQSSLPGDEVKRDSDCFLAQCEAAGRAIAYIHNSGVTGGPTHSVDIELDKVRERMEQYRMSAPGLYLMVRDVLRQIEAKAARLPSEEPVPSHGDYKYNQFLFDGERFGLLDLEFFAQAEPSFDLGKYCGHLSPAAPKDWTDTALADEGRRIFLDAYCAIRPQYRGRRFALYEAISLTTRTLVVLWGRSRNWEYMAQTLIALAYERLKTPWGE